MLLRVHMYFLSEFTMLLIIKIREAFKTNPSVMRRCQIDDVGALKLLWKRLFDHHNSLWKIQRNNKKKNYKKYTGSNDDGMSLLYMYIASSALSGSSVLSDTLQEQWPFWKAMAFVRESAGDDGPREVVKCHLCPYVVLSNVALRHRRNRLKEHMRGAHGPKDLVCQFCGAKYSNSQPNAFKDHVNALHLKLKPYKCAVEGCGYTCGYKSR